MGARQLDLFGESARALGRALRGRGMEDAEAHADDTVEGWSDMVDDAIAAFVNAAPPGAEFTAADIRAVAEAAGVPIPPDNRAWGGAIRRAKLAGRIKAVGIGKSSDPRQHRGYTTLWGRPT